MLKIEIFSFNHIFKMVSLLFQLVVEFFSVFVSEARGVEHQKRYLLA
tara:strand:+ start:1181 stop:1321 length:141 start_codon:yes stop_codon:yes gene_type:complete